MTAQGRRYLQPAPKGMTQVHGLLCTANDDLTDGRCDLEGGPAACHFRPTLRRRWGRGLRRWLTPGHRPRRPWWLPR